LFRFSYFRANDIELERLQIEASQLIRRSAEVEQREAHDGQLIYYKKLIIENLFFSCKIFKSS
jgi:hypothetical protein